MITIKKGDQEINWWADSRYEKEIEAFFHKPGLFDELPSFVTHYDDGTLDETTKSILNDRIAEYETGKAKAIPAEEVIKKLRNKYGK